MNRLLLGLMLVWLCAPAMVRAARLNSQLRVGGGWDNNVNNTERQEESDTFGLLGGRFTLESEQNVPFTWSLAYEGLYQLYQQESRLDRYWQTFRGSSNALWGQPPGSRGSPHCARPTIRVRDSSPRAPPPRGP
jgi:hypothetical protein